MSVQTSVTSSEGGSEPKPDEGEFYDSDTWHIMLRLNSFHCMETKLQAGESELWVFIALLA